MRRRCKERRVRARGALDLERLIGNLTGHGRVWTNVLKRLPLMADFTFAPPDTEADVWLANGHFGVSGAGRPVLAQMHEAGDPAHRSMSKLAFADALDRAAKETVAAAARILTASEFARNEIASRLDFPAERIDVVPHGVDSTCFRPDAPGGRDAVLRALGTSEDAPYVVFVSSLHLRKNLASLRAAMTLLATRGYPHRLVIVAAPSAASDDSPGLEHQAFADLPGTRGRVARIVAPSDQGLAAVMAGAAAFCLPSLSEGFGLTALEAMACGTPCVVSNRGALPEVVGDAGVIAEPDPESLADALSRLLDDEPRRRALSHAARKRALGFTWEATVRGWIASLEKTAAQR